MRWPSSATSTVVLDAESIPFVDGSAVTMLMSLSDELRASGTRLVIAHDTGRVRDLFRAAQADALLADVCPSVQAAIDALA